MLFAVLAKRAGAAADPGEDHPAIADRHAGGGRPESDHFADDFVAGNPRWRH